MLEEEGFEVVAEAGDGKAAVDLAEQHRPDLVILDVKMPGFDGISAAEKIATARIAPVVILTAFSQRELVERARDAGAMACSSSRSAKATSCRRSRWRSPAMRRSPSLRRRSPSCPSGWRLANSSSGPRACSRRRTDCPSPMPFAGFRRHPWAEADVAEVAQVVIAVTGEGRSDDTG